MLRPLEYDHRRHGLPRLAHLADRVTRLLHAGALLDTTDLVVVIAAGRGRSQAIAGPQKRSNSRPVPDRAP